MLGAFKDVSKIQNAGLLYSFLNIVLAIAPLDTL